MDGQIAAICLVHWLVLRKTDRDANDDPYKGVKD